MSFFIGGLGIDYNPNTRLISLLSGRIYYHNDQNASSEHYQATFIVSDGYFRINGVWTNAYTVPENINNVSLLLAQNLHPDASLSTAPGFTYDYTEATDHLDENRTVDINGIKYWWVNDENDLIILDTTHICATPTISINSNIATDTCTYTHNGSSIEYTHQVNMGNSISVGNYCSNGTHGFDHYRGNDSNGQEIWVAGEGSFTIKSNSNEITEWFRAYNNHNGNSLHSDSVSIKFTRSAHISIKPSNPSVSVKAMSSTSITFKVTGGSNGCGSRFTLQYDDNNTWKNCNSTDNSFIKSNLSAGSTIRVRVRAINDHNVSSDIVESSFTIPDIKLASSDLTINPGFECLKSVGFKVKTSTKIEDVKATIIISTKSDISEIITNNLYFNTFNISEGANGSGESGVINPTNSITENVVRIAQLPETDQGHKTFKYVLTPNTRYYAVINVIGNIYNGGNFNSGDFAFSFTTLSASTLKDMIKLPTLDFNYGYSFETDSDNRRIDPATKIPIADLSSSKKHPIAELGYAKIIAVKKNDSNKVKLKMTFVIENGKSSAINLESIIPTGNTGIVEHELSSGKYNYDGNCYLHLDTNTEGTGYDYAYFPQTLWDKIYKKMKNYGGAKWYEAKIKYQITIIDFSKRKTDTGIEYAYVLGESDSDEADKYRRTYTGAINFKPNIPTAKIGINGKTKRAQVWIGDSNGKPHKAVMYIGNNNTTPKRTI